MDELSGPAALREAQRAKAALDELREQAGTLAERAGAEVELLVGHRRVPEHDRSLGPRRRVSGDDCRLQPRQRRCQLARVRDRRAGEQELRVGAVDRRQPPQASQHVRHMGAEHAAVHVGLVDDDVLEVREHVSPAVVMRQDAEVEHVRVGEDGVGPCPHLTPLLGRRVAVVDRRPHAGHAEGCEAARLILRQSLRRIEIERARLRVAGDRVQDGEVEGQRLAARRAGRDGDVLAAPGCRPRLGLVLEEARDPLAPERGHDSLVELARQRCRRRLPRRLGAEIRDLLAGEQLVRECGGAHPSATTSSVRGSKPSSSSWMLATRSW